MNLLELIRQEIFHLNKRNFKLNSEDKFLLKCSKHFYSALMAELHDSFFNIGLIMNNGENMKDVKDLKFENINKIVISLAGEITIISDLETGFTIEKI